MENEIMEIMVNKIIEEINRKLKFANEAYEKEVALTGNKEWSISHERRMYTIFGMICVLDMITGKRYVINGTELEIQ